MSETITTNWLRRFLLIVTAANVIRMVGGTQRTLATFRGDLAVFHYLPGVGDMLAGVGAAILAALLLRGQLTPGIRRFAWQWNVFGAIDLIVAMPVNTIFRPADPRFFTPLLATGFLACHLVMLVLLKRSRP